MDQEQVTVDGAFLIEWIVVCAITALAGGMLAFMTMWTVGEAATDALGETAGWLVAGSLFGLLFGGGISAGQGIVLRKTGISAAKWVRNSALAAAISMGIGFTVASLTVDMDNAPEIAVGLFIGLLLGLPLGLAQWGILRDHVASPGIWIGVSVLAPVIAMGVGLPLSGEGREILVLGTAGILVAAITGLGMAYMLRREAAVAV